MSKKILSVVLALVLVMSTFALSAFAASKPAYEEDPSEYTQAWKLEDASVGDVYKANIYLEAAYGVGAVQFKIESADKAVLTAVDSDVFVGDYDINFSAEGLVFIVPTPAEGTESMDAIEFADETLIATLTFELAEGADSATVSIENAPKNEENPDGTLVAARVDDGNLVTGTSIVGQDATVDGSATFGAVAAADLAKKAGAEAGIIIDTNKTFGNKYAGVVYGFTQGANNESTFVKTDYLVNNLEATNGGSLAYSRSIGKMGYGTGTVITVKNADGTEAAKYVVVIFGDVDGNGLINVNDIKPMSAHISKTTFIANDSVEMMAANCQNITLAAIMHTVNVNDIKPITAAIAKTANVDQAALASRHASFNTNYQ